MTSPTPPGAAVAGAPLTPGILLAPLLVVTNGLDDAQLDALGRRLYQTHCVGPANSGLTLTHDGQPVSFYRDDYDHAFWTASEKHRRGWAKDFVDEKRVQRARWPLPVIAGQVDGTECWLITDHQSRKHPKPVQRLYVVRSEPYVVYLRARRDGAWAFRTAYCPSWDDIDRYTYRQRRIWQR